MAARDHLPEIISRFKEGESLHSIGASIGVSRERVRQIVVVAGLTGRRGGKSLPPQQRGFQQMKGVQDRRLARDKHRFGCEPETVLALNQGLKVADKQSLAYKFNTHRVNASKRGIEWEFTFPEWIALWENSGHLHERGRPGYCMARFNDIGPYSKTNVYFTTIGGNVADYFAMRRAEKHKH